jgi:hypothetical protein
MCVNLSLLPLSACERTNSPLLYSSPCFAADEATLRSAVTTCSTCPVVLQPGLKRRERQQKVQLLQLLACCSLRRWPSRSLLLLPNRWRGEGARSPSLRHHNATTPRSAATTCSTCPVVLQPRLKRRERRQMPNCWRERRAGALPLASPPMRPRLGGRSGGYQKGVKRMVKSLASPYDSIFVDRREVRACGLESFVRPAGLDVRGRGV